jgi:hypothetical protein
MVKSIFKRYFNLEGKISKYTPDFYVKNWYSYIEVKGYETDLDRCKWKQFKYKLLIYDKNMLKKLSILNINIDNYYEPIFKHKCKICDKGLKRIYKTGICIDCIKKERKKKNIKQ